VLVFSDGLDIAKVMRLYDYFRGRCQVAFGVGTHLTNDLGPTPLNIVIKMVRCNGQPVAKLSDSPGKSMCDDRVTWPTCARCSNCRSRSIGLQGLQVVDDHQVGALQRLLLRSLHAVALGEGDIAGAHRAGRHRQLLALALAVRSVAAWPSASAVTATVEPLADGGQAARLSSPWDRFVVQPGSAIRPLKRMLPLLAWASALTDIRATHSRMEFLMTRSLVRVCPS
jgi:hypothetical protein